MSATERLKRVDELATRQESIVKELAALEKAGVKSRHLSLARTKAEEVKHRLAEEMAELSNA